MTVRVAINGYGRIGRNILRSHYEGGKKHDLAIVAVNDLGPPETNAHLTRHDTTHGKFPGKVEVDGDHMVVDGDRIRVVAQRDPAQLPWGQLGVDVVPECNGKLDGYSIRVPTINVSIVDLSFIAARDTSVDEVNKIMKAASEKPEWSGVLGYNTAPLVSVDFNHDSRSSIFDATLTKVSGRLVKVSSWYDNEWGFSNRMLDVTMALMAAK